MKNIFSIAFAMILAVPFYACTDDDEPDGPGGSNSGSGYEQQGNSSTIVEVSDKIDCKIIGIVDEEEGISEGSLEVSFSRFPASVNEFKQLRSEIGGTAQGIVALQMMACEMAIHNKVVGKKCMELVNASSNIQQMDDLFIKRIGRPEGQGISPYHVAAFLQGTYWNEGYNTQPPYVIKMELKSAAYSSIYQANHIEMRVNYNSGSSLTTARFHIVKTKKPDEAACEGGKYFMIISCGDFLSNASIRVKSFDSVYNGMVPFNK